MLNYKRCYPSVFAFVDPMLLVKTYNVAWSAILQEKGERGGTQSSQKKQALHSLSIKVKAPAHIESSLKIKSSASKFF